MGLLRFQNLIIDWSRVYAVRLGLKGGKIDRVIVFADTPGQDSSEPIAILTRKDGAESLWKTVQLDQRFRKFTGDHPQAIDESKIIFVTKNTGHRPAVATIQLTDARSVAYELDYESAKLFIESFTDSDAST